MSFSDMLIEMISASNPSYHLGLVLTEEFFFDGQQPDSSKGSQEGMP